VTKNVPLVLHYKTAFHVILDTFIMDQNVRHVKAHALNVIQQQFVLVVMNTLNLVLTNAYVILYTILACTTPCDTCDDNNSCFTCL